VKIVVKYKCIICGYKVMKYGKEMKHFVNFPELKKELQREVI